ncbi:MAG: imidazoleglycerol-phosphate dehydratase HisB [Nitrospirae bacterium]|nr:imidazoleglycerol-phosphate dehydratase HisB [Nitrospirota bacterium]MBI3593883.1 imidazoleglycerol-phosphate dehydratase HisB [Nitrospirota bacterium]
MKNKVRKALIERKTAETSIRLSLKIEGTGKSKVHSSIPFLDHMLTLWSKHGNFDLELKSKGDLEIDDHHLVEDIGISLGLAIQKAIGDKEGIRRYGLAYVPMDEALAQVIVDVSGRPYLVYQISLMKKKIKTFDIDLIEHFFEALAQKSGLTLHIHVPYGKNPHHVIEAIFKAFGRALDQALQIDSRIRGVLSTKGIL